MVAKELFLTQDSERILQKMDEEFPPVYFLEETKLKLSTLVKESMRGLREEGQDKKTIIFLTGLPRAGKTHLDQKFLLPSLNTEIQTIPGAHLTFLHWDPTEHETKKTIQEAQRALARGHGYSVRFRDLVQISDVSEDELLHFQFPKGQPYDLKFTSLANRVYRGYVSEYLRKEEPFSLTIAEKPGGTLLVDDKTFSPIRDYDDRIFHDLHFGKDVFQGIPRESFRLVYIGVVPGPNMEILAMARDLIQKARSLGGKQLALEKANEVASTIGLPLFSSYENLKGFEGGASMRQIFAADQSAVMSLYREEGDKIKAKFNKKHGIQSSRLDNFSFTKSMRFLRRTIDLADTERMRTGHQDLLDEELLRAGNIEQPLLDLMLSAMELANLKGTNSLTADLLNALHMLVNAEVLWRNARDYADLMTIVINNPPLNISDKQKLRELITRHGLNSS